MARCDVAWCGNSAYAAVRQPWALLYLCRSCWLPYWLNMARSHPKVLDADSEVTH